MKCNTDTIDSVLNTVCLYFRDITNKAYLEKVTFCENMRANIAKNFFIEIRKNNSNHC